jgi:fructose 1,6-bisphosphatase
MAEQAAVEALQRRMTRVDSALEMIMRAGHMTTFDNVAEVCWLIQKEVREVAEQLETLGQSQTDGQERPSGKVEASDQVPAPAEVLQFRPSRG